MTSMRIGTLFGILTCLLFGGCDDDEIYVEDDLDFELFEYELHTPYVVGANVVIWFNREDDGPVSGWHMTSRDPSVFSVASGEVDAVDESMRYECKAVGPGDTLIAIYDQEGSTRATRLIRVVQPDRLKLIPAGQQRIHQDQGQELDQTKPVLVLKGGQATFEVEYYRQAERLFGNGALQLTSSDQNLQAENLKTYLWENREWLSLSPLEMGTANLMLEVGDASLGELPVQIVGEVSIAEVSIESQETKYADDGEQFYLWARAFDSSLLEIFGVDFEWVVNGSRESGEGDLFWYTYREGATSYVTASAGNSSDEVSVEMSDGFVTSSNEIGCSTGSGADLTLGLFALMGLLVRALHRKMQPIQ